MKDILLITIDSLRYDHLRCCGYGRETSPKIDELAETGHLFHNCFSQGPTTRTSFPVILTSTYSSMYGGFRQVTDQRTLISEALEDGGYATAGFHSNPNLSAEFGYNRGFGKFYDSMTDASTFSKFRQYIKTGLDSEGYTYRLFNWLYQSTERNLGVDVGSAYTDGTAITDYSLGWIESVRSADAPRFLWTHYMDVHHPYVPPEEHQLAFRDDPIGEREAVRLRRKMLENPDDVTDDEREDIVHLYDAEIRYTDHEIGRLVDAVRNQWGEETLIVLTSDHGEQFYEHGEFSHNGVYDEILHVPLIIDGVAGSDEYEEIVGLIDIAPTLVDYAGISKPEIFLGNTLRAVLESGDWDRESVKNVYITNDTVRTAYRDKRWKYISYNSDRLYDIQQDPGETKNVIDANPDIAASIREELEEPKRLVSETSSDVGSVDVNEETKQRLQALGYSD